MVQEEWTGATLAEEGLGLLEPERALLLTIDQEVIVGHDVAR
jgi:hypothetical protein